MDVLWLYSFRVGSKPVVLPFRDPPPPRNLQVIELAGAQREGWTSVEVAESRDNETR